MSAATPIRLLLVDDHAVVRAGYRALLEEAADIRIVAEADSGEAACRAYVAHAPDLVAMDLSLPGMGGLAALERIVARDPAARVLVVSMHEDVVFVAQALRAGARGYVAKSSRPETLPEAVRRVASGGTYLDAEIASRLALQQLRGDGTPLADLSTREFEIFCLLAEGLDGHAIARRLSLGYKTVANYTTQIKEKLGVSSLVELARLAIRLGVVPP